MLRHIRIAFVALLAVLAFVAPAAAQNTDQRVIATDSSLPDEEIGPYITALTQSGLSGRVVDAAGVLDPANRKALVARLETLDAATGDQLIVATVASLHGHPIESYANRLFNILKLGQKKKNNAVLLLVAPAERKVRIEIGDGLGGRLTDAVAKDIIDQSIAPRFGSGDFAAGIARAVDAIAAVLTGAVGSWQMPVARHSDVVAQRAPDPDRHVTNLPPVLGVLLMAVTYGGGALMVAFVVFVVIFASVRFFIAIHLLPQRKKRSAFWLWLNFFDNDMYDRRGRRVSSASDSSGPSGSSSSFSGGGGSSGGGGASGSW